MRWMEWNSFAFPHSAPDSIYLHRCPSHLDAVALRNSERHDMDARRELCRQMGTARGCPSLWIRNLPGPRLSLCGGNRQTIGNDDAIGARTLARAVHILPQSFSTAKRSDLQEDSLGRPVTSAIPIPCLNQTVLADLRALSKARGRDFVSELSGTFFGVLPERIGAISTAAVTGDARAFSDAAHKLKGGAACIGGDRLAALCGRLEAIGDAGSLDDADTLIEELRRETEDLRQALTHQGAGLGGQR